MQVSPTVAKCSKSRSGTGAQALISASVANCRTTVARARSCDLSPWFHRKICANSAEVSHARATVGYTFGYSFWNGPGTSAEMAMKNPASGMRCGAWGVGTEGERASSATPSGAQKQAPFRGTERVR